MHGLAEPQQIFPAQVRLVHLLVYSGQFSVNIVYPDKDVVKLLVGSIWNAKSIIWTEDLVS